MKKILLIWLAIGGALALRGQPGTLQLTAGAQIRTTGGARLVLDNMNIVNNGSLLQKSGGFVKLTGGMNVSLSGTGTTVIDELLMDKSGASTLSLQSEVGVLSKVTFAGGLIDLGNSVLNLGSTGILAHESETSRAFTTGLGYVKAVSVLNSPPGVNVGNMGATITSSDNLGSTTVRRGHQQQTNVGGAGNNSILRYYDIEPTNNISLKATLRLQYLDAELEGVPEASLYQWKSKDNVNWDFVGADARDATVNYVERNNISKFERFTLAKGTAPTIQCPGNMTVTSNQKGCTASVTLNATASGIPAPTITYRIGNTVIRPTHTFPKGTTKVSATASNGVAPNATCTFTVTVVCAPTTTTQPVTDTREVLNTPLVITARPNPSASYFTLNLSSGEQAPVSLRVVDLLGREVEARSNVAPNSTLAIGYRYRPGVYIVQAAQGSRVVILRLVKGTE